MTGAFGELLKSLEYVLSAMKAQRKFQNPLADSYLEDMENIQMNANEIFTYIFPFSMNFQFSNLIVLLHSVPFLRAAFNIFRISVLNVPSTVDLYKKESSSTPQMFIFPLAN
jgi:hypothetical protein